MAEIRTADVVQEMIWKIVKETGLTQEELGRFMEAWAEIRRMEGTTPQTPPAPAPLTQGSQEAESTPEGVEKVHPDRVEKVHEDEPESIPDRGEGPPFSPAEPDSFPKGDAKDGVVQNGPDPAKSAAAAAGMANRKRNDMARLEALRARGVSMQTVAESAAGLTLNDVLDFLDRKPIQLPKLVALEKAMKKLEAGA